MRFLKTISVFALALLVLISSSSFMIGIHRCAGKVQDMALFSKPEKCEMEKNLPPCHQHLTDPCCDDETILHEGEGFKASISDITISPASFLDLDIPAVLIAEIIPSNPVLKTPYYNYDPPLVSYDLTVSHRVLLI